jgi:hypothetical protein
VFLLRRLSIAQQKLPRLWLHLSAVKKPAAGVVATPSHVPAAPAEMYPALVAAELLAVATVGLC